MDCTLLGTGTAIGMPAVSCDCTYCKKNLRSRPSLIIEKNDTGILFDASPDVSRQLNGSYNNIDHIFLTHHHHDHASGLMDLNHTTLSLNEVLYNTELADDHIMFNQDYKIYGSQSTIKFIRENMSYVLDRESFNVVTIDKEQTIKIDDIEIKPVESTHCEGYSAFRISDRNKNVFYHPDFGEIQGSIETDISVIDGSSALGYNIHCHMNDFEKMNNKINSDTKILTNVSEHLAQSDREKLERRAENHGLTVVDDGYEF